MRLGGCLPTYDQALAHNDEADMEEGVFEEPDVGFEGEVAESQSDNDNRGEVHEHEESAQEDGVEDHGKQGDVMLETGC